jgi:hypothetical protein
MRTIFVLVVLIFSATVKAQTPLTPGFMNNTQRYSFTDISLPQDSTHAKKWMLNKYSGISTTFSFFNGGNATVLAVPVGLQLTRRLNNNLYAFAGVSVAPAYVNFNHSFLSANTNKYAQNNGVFNSNGLNLYSRAELGLMYVNDQKTFSVSGSIGVERSSNPVFSGRQINALRPNTVIIPNR